MLRSGNLVCMSMFPVSLCFPYVCCHPLVLHYFDHEFSVKISIVIQPNESGGNQPSSIKSEQLHKSTDPVARPPPCLSYRRAYSSRPANICSSHCVPAKHWCGPFTAVSARKHRLPLTSRPQCKSGCRLPTAVNQALKTTGCASRPR